MIASLVYFLIVSVETTEHCMAIVAALTIVTWLAVTLLSPPEDRRTLLDFYRRIHPGGPGWRPQARQLPEVKPDRNLGQSILAAVFGGGIVYFVLPAVGFLIFGKHIQAVFCLAGAVLCALVVHVLMRKIGWEQIV